jgi:hypothetical protein
MAADKPVGHHFGCSACQRARKHLPALLRHRLEELERRIAAKAATKAAKRETKAARAEPIGEDRETTRPLSQTHSYYAQRAAAAHGTRKAQEG